MQSKKMISTTGVSVVTLCLLAGLGCSKSGSGTGADYVGQINIKLIDAPATYDQIDVVVQRVEVHRKQFSAENGWTVVNDQTSTYELLHLRNGVSDTLVFANAPIGDYDQINVHFGFSFVVVDGVRRDLLLPADLANGYIINFPFTIDQDLQYQLTFDFNALKSVTQTSPTQYTLQPVIRVRETLLSGSISGGIVPSNSLSTVFTLDGADTVTAYADPNNGTFVLVDIPEAVYDVHIIPGYSAFRDTVISGVTVTRQKDTFLGVINLQLSP